LALFAAPPDRTFVHETISQVLVDAPSFLAFNALDETQRADEENWTLLEKALDETFTGECSLTCVDPTCNLACVLR
jgi:hypothetical protein